jgi:hypothetical protein
MTKRNEVPTVDRGEIRVVCACCDTVLETTLKPIDETGITFDPTICGPCDQSGADLDAIAHAETYVDLFDNPATPWTTQTLANALSAVVRGYKVTSTWANITSHPDYEDVDDSDDEDA